MVHPESNTDQVQETPTDAIQPTEAMETNALINEPIIEPTFLSLMTQQMEQPLISPTEEFVHEDDDYICIRRSKRES